MSTRLDNLMQLSSADIITRLQDEAGLSLRGIATEIGMNESGGSGLLSQIKSGKRVPGENIFRALQRLAISKKIV